VYAVLAGGVGAARFLRGLTQVVPPEEVVAIVNVGDDLTHLGLRICPDLDSITYWLGGVVHPEQQWGRADETHVVAGELARLGHEPWFTLGDRDLGVHLHRSARLAEGVPLSVVTDEVRRAFDVEVRLLPATDDPVETRIHTADGRDLHFQEYWVRERAAPPVASVELAGRGPVRRRPRAWSRRSSTPTRCWSRRRTRSCRIGTILAVPGLAATLRQTPAPVVGVSPIVGGQVVRGMAHRLLPAVGAEVSAPGWPATTAPVPRRVCSTGG
jgi:LPPG:FO 2-phospho-L-lactate transferase